ncbi:MAG: serine/threonine-protein phosphatase [Gammaproteobacteria bacterium]|nr:serine/threonine-protein phosphatase [Gammaproteobacteria bacterium]MBU1653536.1 serine/threonine-protein phosphatase [Gammaproteobacteria bacterium]MBU1961878.1 serine/threonine-protein phosphatase [Gammaproteobacteria bacterium]
MINQWLASLFPAKAATPVWAVVTDQGDRVANEDFQAHLALPEGILLVVADGLGGHQAGELASALFCEALIRLAPEAASDLTKAPEEALTGLAMAAARAMGEEIRERAPGLDAHTTCAIAWVALPERRLTTLHVGDTRIYRFDNKTSHWRSRDHSVVQMLLDMGEIGEEEMAGHPEQSLLTRSIGVGQEPRPSVKCHDKPLRLDEAILLCSDGLWERLRPGEICGLAADGEREQRLRDLVRLARQRADGKSDNITAQLLWFEPCQGAA